MKPNETPEHYALDRYTVRVVDRALEVLELLRDAGRPLALHEISNRLGIVKSSGFRLLCTLERRGYVERADSNGGYRLGARLLSYRDASMTHRPLTEVALPHMHRLHEAFGETINLGVLRDGEVLYLEMLESPHSFRMAARIGTRSPMHSTALGKAIAAYLPAEEVEAIIRVRGLPALTPRTITSPAGFRRELARIKARGYSEDNGETEPEASCLGAPIFGASGEVVGAISLSGPTSRVRPIKAKAARALVEACAAISRGMGFGVLMAGSAQETGTLRSATMAGRRAAAKTRR
ncbi:MAG: IclR family transcriptional regulator [Armatimonadota bacterium]|nr:IclR family transcriptional regulator [Armatimonadota bacterium]